MEKRRFSAGAFDGPLDLLWKLIRDNEVDVHDIPICSITEQFLEYLDCASSVDLGDLSDFYRMASKLVHIKSQILLPVPPVLENEFEFEDPRADLVESLIEYQRFKQLSSLIEEHEDESEWKFERRRIRRRVPDPETDEDVWRKIDTNALLEQMRKIYRGLMSSISISKILDMNEEISVNEKLTLMEEIFERRGECLFSELVVRKENLLDLVCAFMAVLEAVKFKMATIYQNRAFGEIKICRAEDN